MDLDGVVFGFRFDYNSRRDGWALRVYDSNGNVVLGGVPIQQAWKILMQYEGRDDMPTGDLIPIDESGEGKDPGRDDLGQDIKLFYEESGGA